MKRFLNFLKNKIGNKYSIIFIVIALLFLILKLFFLEFKFSDGNTYFYMSNMILEGQFPYQDFFLASPPLQIILITPLLWFLKAFSLNLVFLKIIPVLAVILSAYFIYLFSKKILPSLYSLIPSFLYLFSFVVLTTSDFSTGIHLTVFFLVISLYVLYNKKKPFLAGCFAALSLLVRLYAGVAVLGILIYLLVTKRELLLKFIFGVSTIFIPVNLLLWGVFGNSYINSVFMYHLLKTEGISKMNIVMFFLKWDAVLLIFSFLSIFFKKRKKILLPLIVGGVGLSFYIFYADIYYLYFGLLIPVFAILAGWGIYNIYQKTSKKHPLTSVFIMALIFSFILFYNSAFYIKNHAQVSNIDFIDEITQYVKENSSVDDRIYGSYEIAPLVALRSERGIVGNHIDTNEKTFLTGMFDIEKRTEKIKDKVKFVILRSVVNNRGEVVKVDNIIKRDFLSKECSIEKVYPIKKGYDDNAVLLFNCLN